ncbi:hypothetical protein LA262_004693 [Vibrio parahaemolyticus]|uniref:hypothetical protein n=1 Tax=Vibrio parahaemolyticus TaxID=670 RepID=UPI00084AC396|nr:hypothetical protein [Vibrio parahaemolyticus]EID0733665.1 hypothetical protein [Vibrio parahaemolyticus]ELA9417298.1 hypothetical protein [Vibrio parahaemolyticus]ODY13054.1 hypothetical protein BBM16_16220 [Vibrio parahaemolyticus]
MPVNTSCISVSSCNINRKHLTTQNENNLDIRKVSNTRERAKSLECSLPLSVSKLNSEEPLIKVNNENGSVLRKDIKLVTAAIESKIGTLKSKSKLNSTLSNIRKIVNGSSNERFTLDEVALLALYLDKLSGILPKGELKELTKLINIQIECCWVKMKNDQHLLKRISDLQFMNNAGSAFKNSVSVGGSIGYGFAATANSAGVKNSVTAGLNVDMVRNVFVDDDQTIFEQHSKGISLNGGADCDFTLANLGVKAQVKTEKILQKEYSSVEHFASNEHVRFSLRKMKSTFADKFSSNSAKSLHEAQRDAYNTSIRLNQLMHSVLGLNADIFCIKPANSTPNEANINVTSVDLGGKTHAGVKDLNVGLVVSANQSLTVLNIEAEGYQKFVEDLKRVSELPSEFYFRVKDEIELDSSKENLLKLLGVLESDVANYNSIVKMYDGEKLNNGANSNLKNALKTEKHAIENRWSAIGRHQFLQFVAASHAYISKLLIEANFDDMNAIKRCEALIYNPDFAYSAVRLRKLTTLPKVLKLKITDNKSSFGLSVGPFSGKLEINHRDFKHCSRVRDGRYIDVIISGQASAALSMLNINTLNKKINEILAGEGLSDIVGSVSFTPDINGGITLLNISRWFKPNYSKNNNFPGDKGWRKQFTRTALSRHLGGNLSTSGGLGIVFGANLSASESNTKISKENIGTHDLTYTIARFNHAYTNNGSKIDNNEWQHFFDQNKLSYVDLFKNMSNTDSALSKEVSFFFTELKDQATASQKEEIIKLEYNFFNSMKKLNEQPFNEELFNEARVHFEDFLERQVSPWIDIINEKWWKPSPYKQDTISGNKFETKILRILNIHPRDKNNQEKNQKIPEISRL